LAIGSAGAAADPSQVSDGLSIDFHKDYYLISGRKDLIASIRASTDKSCGDLQKLVRRRFVEMDASQQKYDAVSKHGIEQWKAFRRDKNPDAHDERLRLRCEILADQN
jgi:hypothetical protein